MIIHGKREGFFRIFGSFLVLLTFIMSILFNMLAIPILLLYLTLVLTIFPAFLMSVLLKLEKNVIVKYSIKILLMFAIIIVVINLIIIFFYNPSTSIFFILFEFSDLLLLCCWHFSLTLYKKLKVIFILSGLGSFFIKLGLWLTVAEPMVFFAFLMPIYLIGLFLIILTEFMMIKKGILNYI